MTLTRYIATLEIDIDAENDEQAAELAWEVAAQVHTADERVNGARVLRVD